MYDIKTTLVKKPLFPIPNYLHATYFLYVLDPIAEDVFLLNETMDKRVALQWLSKTKTDTNYKLIVSYPGSYYTTTNELRWCDTVASNRYPIFDRVPVPESNDLPF